MRNATRFSALAILGVLASGCGGTPTDPSPGPNAGACGINSTTDTMTATIDGQPWSSILTLALSPSGVVSITGNDGCTPSRVVTFNLFAAGPGTYRIPETQAKDALDTAGLAAVYSVGTNPGWDAQYGHGTGNVTFSTLSATGATGTFQFNVQPMIGNSGGGSHTITNGAFNVRFTVR